MTMLGPPPVLRFSAILQHLLAPLDRCRHGGGGQHQPPLSRQLRGRGRHQDRLHQPRRLQPDRLGASAATSGSSPPCLGGTSTAQRNAKMAELLDLGFGEAPANVAVSEARRARTTNAVASDADDGGRRRPGQDHPPGDGRADLAAAQIAPGTLAAPPAELVVADAGRASPARWPRPAARRRAVAKAAPWPKPSQLRAEAAGACRPRVRQPMPPIRPLAAAGGAATATRIVTPGRARPHPSRAPEEMYRRCRSPSRRRGADGTRSRHPHLDLWRAALGHQRRPLRLARRGRTGAAEDRTWPKARR